MTPGPGARSVLWRRVDVDHGLAAAQLTPAAAGWTVHGSEIVSDAAPRTCTFRVDLDPEWRTRTAEVEVVDAAGVRRVTLTADARREWTRDGAPARDLAGCDDVDVAATRLTNTFPIRRLSALATGETATLDVAWVEVPSLAVRRVAQHYTRLGPKEWQYADDTFGAFALTVDADGLVVDYAGFATRIAT